MRAAHQECPLMTGQAAVLPRYSAELPPLTLGVPPVSLRDSCHSNAADPQRQPHETAFRHKLLPSCITGSWFCYRVVAAAQPQLRLHTQSYL